jgi:uncharacterized protein
MSPERLQARTRKELEALARRRGVPGVRQLAKPDLIAALTTPSKTVARRSAEHPPARRPGAVTTRAAIDPTGTLPGHDELHVELQDREWLRVSWQVSRLSLDRAMAALGREWHGSVPVLQLIDVTPDESSDAPPKPPIEAVLQPGQPVWFLRVPDPDRVYRVSLGYRARGGRNHMVIRSRPVIPSRLRPRPTAPEQAPPQATQRRSSSAEHFGGLRLRLVGSGNGMTGKLAAEPSAPPLNVELDLVVHGVSDPHADVTLMAKPMPLDRHGGFRQVLPLVGGRHVIPIVATGEDGTGERTVVVALDVSVRELEPRLFEEL